MTKGGRSGSREPRGPVPTGLRSLHGRGARSFLRTDSEQAESVPGPNGHVQPRRRAGRRLREGAGRDPSAPGRERHLGGSFWRRAARGPRRGRRRGGVCRPCACAERAGRLFSRGRDGRPSRFCGRSRCRGRWGRRVTVRALRRAPGACRLRARRAGGVFPTRGAGRPQGIAEGTAGRRTPVLLHGGAVGPGPVGVRSVVPRSPGRTREHPQAEGGGREWCLGPRLPGVRGPRVHPGWVGTGAARDAGPGQGTFGRRLPSACARALNVSEFSGATRATAFGYSSAGSPSRPRLLPRARPQAVAEVAGVWPESPGGGRGRRAPPAAAPVSGTSRCCALALGPRGGGRGRERAPPTYSADPESARTRPPSGGPWGTKPTGPKPSAPKPGLERDPDPPGPGLSRSTSVVD